MPVKIELKIERAVCTKMCSTCLTMSVIHSFIRSFLLISGHVGKSHQISVKKKTHMKVYVNVKTEKYRHDFQCYAVKDVWNKKL